MKEGELIGVRIYGEKHGDLWVLITLDFCLGSQARTLPEAIKRINDQIQDYLYDAYFGTNREFRTQLLNRKAPTVLFIKYYWALFSQTFHKLNSKVVFLTPFSV